jgi:hypothetical protein
LEQITRPIGRCSAARLKFRRDCPANFHLLRFNNSQCQPQIFLFGPADDQVIKVFPLRDFMFGAGDPSADDFQGIRAASMPAQSPTDFTTSSGPVPTADPALITQPALPHRIMIREITAVAFPS